MLQDTEMRNKNQQRKKKYNFKLKDKLNQQKTYTKRHV